MDSKATEELAKCPVVQKGGTEFSKIEYMLQLSLGTATAEIATVWNIEKSHLKLSFENVVKKRKLLMINSFVDAADLKGATVDSIIKQGFPVPSEGRDFTAGMLKLTRIRNSTYRVILCKVAVGKTLYLSNQLAGRKGKAGVEYDDEMLQDGIYLAEARDRMVREQYESFYIKQNDSDDMNVYRYEYRIFDSALVHPLYVIDFTFDPNKESERKVTSSLRSRNLFVLSVNEKRQSTARTIGRISVMRTTSRYTKE